MSIKSKTLISNLLDSKEIRIRKILNEPEPISDTLYETHLKRQINSVKFLDELDEVKLVLLSDEEVQLSSFTEFQNIIKAADFSSIEFNGEFCKLALIQTVGLEDSWALYVASLESI